MQVPCRFQDIVEQLEERGGTAAASQPGAALGNGTAVGAGGGAANGAAGEGQLPRKFTITPPERGGEPVAATLAAGGHAFHVVNTQLLLLASFQEYLAFRDAVPAFRAEVAQRVLELLKVFNSRTCQLVLGAGAMQVRSGAAGWRLLPLNMKGAEQRSRCAAPNSRRPRRPLPSWAEGSFVRVLLGAGSGRAAAAPAQPACQRPAAGLAAATPRLSAVVTVPSPRHTPLCPQASSPLPAPPPFPLPARCRG